MLRVFSLGCDLIEEDGDVGSVVCSRLNGVLELSKASMKS